MSYGICQAVRLPGKLQTFQTLFRCGALQVLRMNDLQLVAVHVRNSDAFARLAFMKWVGLMRNRVLPSPRRFVTPSPIYSDCLTDRIGFFKLSRMILEVAILD